MKFGERASRSLHKLRVCATRAQCLLQIPMWFSLCVRTELPPRRRIYSHAATAHIHTHAHVHALYQNDIMNYMSARIKPPRRRPPRFTPFIYSYIERSMCALIFKSIVNRKKNSIEIRICTRAKELYYLAIQINGHFIWQHKKHFLIKFLFTRDVV